MPRLIQEPKPAVSFPDRPPLYVAAAAALLLPAFFVAPGDISSKTHAALHGLCAQRPSHSLQIGGSVLPMDARMTGIYVGAAATLIWLIAARRLRSSRPPSLSVIAILALFVIVLAIDGFNALLVDLQFPTLYEPSNMLRLATGALAGTSLGVALGYLFASSLWAGGDRRRAVVMGPGELLAPLGLSAAIAALAFLDLPLLYAPFAAGLLLAAIGVFWVLGMIVLALLSSRGWSCRTWGDVAPVALASFWGAIATISALALVRFAVEQLFGLPKLT
jgi:uncharacterized membrane protein